MSLPQSREVLPVTASIAHRHGPILLAYCGAAAVAFLLGGVTELQWPIGDAAWRTPSGDRVLTEQKWSLFAAGVDMLWNQIEYDIEMDEDDADLGLVAFDRLTPEQKLVMLADVANALKSVSVKTPRHTASNEATIAAVFSVLYGALECEIDVATDEELPPSASICHLLLTCCSNEGGLEDPLPDANSEDLEAWEWILEEIERRANPLGLRLPVVQRLDGLAARSGRARSADRRDR